MDTIAFFSNKQSTYVLVTFQQCKLWAEIIAHKQTTYDTSLPTRYSVHYVWCNPFPANQLRAKLHKMPLQWNQQQSHMQLLSVQNCQLSNTELSILIILNM